MDLFSPRHVAAEGSFPPPPPAYADLSPIRLALALLSDLSRALNEPPHVLYPAGVRTVAAYFPKSCFLLEDFLQDYHEILSVLSRQWEAVAFGTVDGTEIGEVRFSLQEGRIAYQKANVTGRDFAALSDLCLQFTVPDEGTCAFLAEAFSKLRHSCIPVHRRFCGLCAAAGLGEPRDGARFLYLPLEPDVTVEDFLDCLTVASKVELWAEYLTDGVSPLEFDWQMDALGAGQARGLLEWELALRLALPQAGFSVEREPGQFRLTGPGGRPVRLDYRTAPSAGRLLLKILFPAIPPTAP